MQGWLIFRDGYGTRIEKIPRDSLQIGIGPTGSLNLARAGTLHSPLASVEWDPSRPGWSLSAVFGADGASRIRLLGGAIPSRHPLSDGDLFHAGQAAMWFREAYLPPTFRGAPFAELPVRDLHCLCFGRSPEAAQAGEEMVVLDAEDRRVSRRHVLFWRDGSNFYLRDESPMGAFLNGQRFQSQQLTIGDRFEVGGYSFEFTGISLRRTEPRMGSDVCAAGVGFAAGNRTILSNVSLLIDKCSFTGILGGSGQGKSTLLNALCGINPATSGAVLIDGHRIEGAGAMNSAGIGFVPQDDIVHPELRVGEAIRFSARLRLDPRVPGPAIERLVDDAMERLGLSEHREKRISLLSGGQRKRVSIATELLSKPSVLFLDEPSSGLDPATEFALMRILRALAAHDCTVICTTHVLGRAYLFDRIVFIHGGRVIFDGSPDMAYKYFQVETLDQVYLRLAEDGRTGDDWAADFAASDRAPASEPVSPPPVEMPDEPIAALRRSPGFLRALGILLLRQWSILAADKLNLLFLAAQPLLIALIVGWVAEDYVLRMFLCIVATLWFGCSNGAQQIIREISIFRRERLCGLGLNSYLLSKYVFLGLITTLQAAGLLFVVQTTSHLVRPAAQSPASMEAELAALTSPRNAPRTGSGGVEEFDAVGSPPSSASPASSPAAPRPPFLPRFDVWPAAVLGWFFELRWNLRDSIESAGRSLYSVLATAMALKFLALAATALVGVAIGLTISGLVQNSSQAIMWVPLLLIPQILFGGVVLSLPELSQAARTACALIPSFSCERLMDVSNVYGQALPLLSNRTKIPLFLTPGEKEVIRWTVGGRTFSESYDKLSPFNTSWQNLAVFPRAVGRHRHASSEVLTAAGSAKKFYAETTESRADVRYSKGRVFLDLHPVFVSLGVLFVWMGACYAATFLALSLRQKGK